ncbi:chitin binding peritrophin-A domain-containing protein [Streptomyces xanthophaeus]
MAADEPRAVTKGCPGPNQCYGEADFTKFCECSNGIAYLFDCPAGLHRDLTLLTSNYPEQANRVEGDHLPTWQPSPPCVYSRREGVPMRAPIRAPIRAQATSGRRGGWVQRVLCGSAPVHSPA